MTNIRAGAWWCEYCANYVKGQCSKDVPYYCSSPNCVYWREHPADKPRKRFNIKKILVDTI